LAEHAEFPIAAAGGAVFATVEDDLEVEFVPCIPWKELFQIAFGLFNVFAGAESALKSSA